MSFLVRIPSRTPYWIESLCSPRFFLAKIVSQPSLHFHGSFLTVLSSGIWKRELMRSSSVVLRPASAMGLWVVQLAFFNFPQEKKCSNLMEEAIPELAIKNIGIWASQRQMVAEDVRHTSGLLFGAEILIPSVAGSTGACCLWESPSTEESYFSLSSHGSHPVWKHPVSLG